MTKYIHQNKLKSSKSRGVRGSDTVTLNEGGSRDAAKMIDEFTAGL